MNKSDSYDSKLSEARGLASQLGMFAEENDIPKDLWGYRFLQRTCQADLPGLLLERVSNHMNRTYSFLSINLIKNKSIN